MRWSRSLQTIDVHCAGEVGRVITSGVLDIPGDTMAAKLAYLNHQDDSLRRFLCSEPRSSPAGSFVLLLPPCDPTADTGFIVLQPDQAHAMSGSNAICAVTALLEMGIKPMQEPVTKVVLDTAAGLVVANAYCDAGKVTKVTLAMPGAFCMQQEQSIVTAKWGNIVFDICFGGVFYALVDVTQLALHIVPEQARELATAGINIRKLMQQTTQPTHPVTPELNGIAYVMFFEQQEDGSIRTCTTMRPGRVDRSPCGTGSTAYMAALAAKQALPLGYQMTTHSIIGSEFSVQLLSHQKIADYTAIDVSISGQAWLYGMSHIGLDPSDPFPQGFIVADTWGIDNQ